MGLKRIVIIGASNGMGRKCAEIFAKKGYQVAIAARNTEKLQHICSEYMQNMIYMPIDVTKDDCGEKLKELITKNGGMDVYFHVSGTGFHNEELEYNKEISTLQVNAMGFTRMVVTAFNYFRENHINGHIACITSIAGTKGLGAAAAYSSTKRFQNTYIESLEQLSHMNKLGITFTDIKPGFVKTDLLDSKRNYPLLMDTDKVSESIVKAIENKKRKKVINNLYALITFFWSLIPSWLWVRLPIRN